MPAFQQINSLEGIALSFALLSLGLYCCAALLVVVYHLLYRLPARRAAWRQREAEGSESNDSRTGGSKADLPSVSILKPLCGHDEELERNLASYALLDYPRLEILCRAEDPFDPALAIARRVAKRFPNVRFQILGGARPGAEEAANPKVAQLEAMLPAARGEIIHLSDSNVRIGSMDLRALTAAFQNPRVGLVYQPFFGEGERTLGAALENCRNSEFPGMLCVGAKLFAGQEVVTAKGILVRRSVLKAIGDFEPIRAYHNDDHLLAMAVRRQGWKLALAPIPAREIQVKRPFAEMLRRHARHAAGRWRCCGLSCLLEVLFNPVLVGLPLLVCGASASYAYLLIAISKWALEMMAGRALRGTWLAPRFWIALPIKDVVMPMVLVRGLLANRVSWRGRVYRMKWMSRLEPLGSTGAATLRPSRDVDRARYRFR